MCLSVHASHLSARSYWGLQKQGIGLSIPTATGSCDTPNTDGKWTWILCKSRKSFNQWAIFLAHKLPMEFLIWTSTENFSSSCYRLCYLFWSGVEKSRELICQALTCYPSLQSPCLLFQTFSLVRWRLLCLPCCLWCVFRALSVCRR